MKQQPPCEHKYKELCMARVWLPSDTGPRDKPLARKLEPEPTCNTVQTHRSPRKTAENPKVTAAGFRF